MAAAGLIRLAVVLAGTFAVSLVADVRMRLILLRFRAGDERRIVAMNRAIRWWGETVFRLCRAAFALHVQVEGRVPAEGRYLVLSNHQSTLDIPVLFGVLPGLDLKFVAREDLRYGKPAVSVALRNAGFVVVAKRDLGEDLTALRRFGEELARHHGSAVLFPEGERTRDGSPLPFGFGGAEMVRRTARLPILPVTIDGLAPGRTLFQLHRVVGATVRVRIAEPIPFDRSEADPRAAFAEVERTIRDGLE